MRPTGLVSLLSCLFLCQCVTQPKLSELRKIECTLFPDRRGECDWSDCCAAHDRAYWIGGTRQQRLAADRKLRDCVTCESNSRFLGNLMFTGVRIFGHGWLPTPFRWGFGWNCLSPYQPVAASPVDVNATEP